ncbi:MAG: site-specific DNA-methyltransferase [Elusimicrobia bacterium]|nr:site-specific DNA-methyltransferase [Elusimicrobiota bacterium]
MGAVRVERLKCGSARRNPPRHSLSVWRSKPLTSVSDLYRSTNSAPGDDMSKKRRLEYRTSPSCSGARLIEDAAHSYGDPRTANKLIHGDNLFALQALQQGYAEKIQCICIDPPYNTGGLFKHYDDGAAHAEWLVFMRRRIKLLKNLLSKSGFFVCHIDDNESPYLKIMLDEVFGRKNYLTTIYVRARYADATAKQDKDPHFHKEVEQILIYRKQLGATPNLKAGIPVQDFYDANDLGNRRIEGGIDFRGGKKPERLIRVILEHFSKMNDYVLDCFLGSGTTAAVAHKMKRRWIGIEIGPHMKTHCLPRLRKVVDGTDKKGVSKVLRWRGGGGFRFYETVPTQGQQSVAKVGTRRIPA